VTVDDPWGYGASLEWATSCPPPRHNFSSLPRIRSERPAFDLHHPEVAAHDTPTEDKNLLDRAFGEPEMHDRGTDLNADHPAEGKGNQGVQD
jgi:cytochrome c oxidase subunit 1